jgi:hypothetical protein
MRNTTMTQIFTGREREREREEEGWRGREMPYHRCPCPPLELRQRALAAAKMGGAEGGP